MLSDFLLAPAALRDFMTLRQFTDIFPKGHRANPAVQDVYRELQRLREKDMDVVRRSITEEVKRSKQLRREYAKERRQVDSATVAGSDPIALQIEQEVLNYNSWLRYGYMANAPTSFLAKGADRTRFKPSTPASTRHGKASRHKLKSQRPRTPELW